MIVIMPTIDTTVRDTPTVNMTASLNHVGQFELLVFI